MPIRGAPLCSQRERADQAGNRHSFTRENHPQIVLRSPHRSFSHHYVLQWRKSPMAHPTVRPGKNQEGSKRWKRRTASKAWKGWQKECVLKGNERGFLAQMTAKRRETLVTATPRSLFSIQATTFSKNAVASSHPPPPPPPPPSFA